MTVDINFHILRGTNGKRYILESYLRGIYRLMDFMKEVIFGKDLFYTYYTTSAGKRSRTPSSIAKHLPRIRDYKRIYAPGYTYSPLIAFFFEEYRKHDIRGRVPVTCGAYDDGVEQFNNFITTMRKNATTLKLKKMLRDWESKQKKQSIRLAKFESELFERHGRVMAVRLDINYHAATFTPDEINEMISKSDRLHIQGWKDFMSKEGALTSNAIEGRIALEEVQADRERFFVNMKGKASLFKHLVGYAWRIEFGREAGYHMHVFLFFNGANVQKHEHIAQLIGEYIRDVITEGRSYFENCNLNKKEYERNDSWALGEINHWDIAKRDNLRHTLQYLCKTNQLVQVIPYPGCHLFGCGFLHRKRKGSGGRPRVRGRDAAIVADHQDI